MLGTCFKDWEMTLESLGDDVLVMTLVQCLGLGPQDMFQGLGEWWSRENDAPRLERRRFGT